MHSSKPNANQWVICHENVIFEHNEIETSDIFFCLYWKCQQLDLCNRLSPLLLHYKAKSMWIPKYYTHVWLLNVSENMGINLYSSGRGFHKMLEAGCSDLLPFSHKRLACSWHCSSSQRCWTGLKSGLCAGCEVFPHQTGKTTSSWTWLCSRGHCHVEREKGLLLNGSKGSSPNRDEQALKKKYTKVQREKADPYSEGIQCLWNVVRGFLLA